MIEMILVTIGFFVLVWFFTAATSKPKSVRNGKKVTYR